MCTLLMYYSKTSFYAVFLSVFIRFLIFCIILLELELLYVLMTSKKKNSTPYLSRISDSEDDILPTNIC